MRIKALQAIIADLHERPGAEQALDHARALLAFYRQEAQRADYLTGYQEPDLVPRPALRRGVRERNYRKKAFSRQFVLAFLREANEPMTALEIGQRLAAEYKPITRQMVNYVLKRLQSAGLATCSEGHPPRWSAAD